MAAKAKSKEVTTIKTTKDTTTAKKTPVDWAVILKIIPALGFVTALLYFLGRLRTESYYKSFGVNPTALSFKPEDYMFSSLDLIILISIILLLGWPAWQKRTSKGKNVFFYGVPVRKGASPKDKIVAIMAVLVTPVTTLLILFIIKPTGMGSGIVGLLFGFSSGPLVFLLLSHLSANTKARVWTLLYLAIIFLAYLPFITEKMTELEARSDLEDLPKAVIITKDELPENLRAQLLIPNMSKEVQVIISNNGMLYVLAPEDSTEDTRQTYAIPDESIKQIIYFSERLR
jgi:flagellar biogenesis protein FliO